MAKKSKTVKELDAELKDLVNIVEDLKQQLNLTKSDLTKGIQTFEKQVNDGPLKKKSTS